MTLKSMKQKFKEKIANFDPVKFQPTHPLTRRDGDSESGRAKLNTATPIGSGGGNGVTGDTAAGKEGMSEEQRKQIKIWLRENRDLNRWGGGAGGAI